MKGKGWKVTIWLLLVGITCFTILSPQALATAGGGSADHGGGKTGGGSTGGGNYSGGGSTQHHNNNTSDNTRNSSPLEAFFLIVVMGAMPIMVPKIRQKQERKANYRARHMQGAPEIPKELGEEVIQLFTAVQNFWSDKKLIEGKHLYSGTLYRKHKELLEEMERNHEHNVVEKIKVTDLFNYMKISETDFKVTIEAKLIDYVYDTQTNQVIRGSKKKIGILTETWYFIRKSNGELIVDYIQ